MCPAHQASRNRARHGSFSRVPGRGLAVTTASLVLPDSQPRQRPPPTERRNNNGVERLPRWPRQYLYRHARHQGFELHDDVAPELRRAAQRHPLVPVRRTASCKRYWAQGRAPARASGYRPERWLRNPESGARVAPTATCDGGVVDNKPDWPARWSRWASAWGVQPTRTIREPGGRGLEVPATYQDARGTGSCAPALAPT